MSKRTRKSSEEQDVVLKFSKNIRLGGQLHKENHKNLHSAFQNWQAELGILKPDRGKMTLESLHDHQGAYADAVMYQGTIARMIHSWCAIAVEYIGKSCDAEDNLAPQRSQATYRRNLRTRRLGEMILQIINRLSDGEQCVHAYKVCAALAGKQIAPMRNP